MPSAVLECTVALLKKVGQEEDHSVLQVSGYHACSLQFPIR